MRYTYTGLYLTRCKSVIPGIPLKVSKVIGIIIKAHNSFDNDTLLNLYFDITPMYRIVSKYGAQLLQYI